MAIFRTIIIIAMLYSGATLSTEHQFLTGTWSGKCKNITTASLNNTNNIINKKSIVTSKPNLIIKHNTDFISIRAQWNIINSNRVGYDHESQTLSNSGTSDFIGLIDPSLHKSSYDKIIVVNTAENMMMIFRIISKHKIVSKQFRVGKNDALAGKCLYYKNKEVTSK